MTSATALVDAFDDLRATLAKARRSDDPEIRTLSELISGHAVDALHSLNDIITDRFPAKAPSEPADHADPSGCPQ